MNPKLAAFLTLGLIVLAAIGGCTARPSSPSPLVADANERQAISLRATEAALRVTATASALRDQDRQRDVEYRALQENTEVSIYVVRGIGLAIVIAAFILAIGLARHLVRWVEVRAVTVRRDLNGQAPIFAIHEGAQWLIHDVDRQVNPAAVLNTTPFAGQLKAGLTGRREVPATVHAPALADPQHQLKVTSQTQSVRLVLAAQRDGRAYTNAKQALAEPAPAWSQPLLAATANAFHGTARTDEDANNEPTEYRIVQLNKGEENYISRLLPGYGREE